MLVFKTSDTDTHCFSELLQFLYFYISETDVLSSTVYCLLFDSADNNHICFEISHSDWPCLHIALKEKFDILEYRLIHFPAERQMNRLIPLSCLYLCIYCKYQSLFSKSETEHSFLLFLSCHTGAHTIQVMPSGVSAPGDFSTFRCETVRSKFYRVLVTYIPGVNVHSQHTSRYNS